MPAKKFYSNVYLYLAIGLILIFWGFSRSYFGRLAETSVVHHVHGISATLWMILLVVQPFLYSRNKLKWHRRLGLTSLILVPALVLAANGVMSKMIQGKEFYPPDVPYQLAFIDLVTLLSFVILYLLAIYHRKNLQLHARLMVCTIFGPMNPATTRIFFMYGLADNFDTGLTYSYILIELVLLLVIWFERKQKAMKFTYLPLFIFFVLQHIFMYYVSGWEWWVNIVDNIWG